MQFWDILKLLALVTVANGVPVVVKKLMGARGAFPLDAGVTLFDGRPLFGAPKTVRGIVLSILATAACAPLIGLDWRVGAVIGVAAMAGDLFASFSKGRLNLPPSSKATGLDQIPESLFPALACQQALSLAWTDIVAVVLIFFVGEILLSRLLYVLRIRDRPY